MLISCFAWNAIVGETYGSGSIDGSLGSAISASSIALVIGACIIVIIDRRGDDERNGDHTKRGTIVLVLLGLITSSMATHAMYAEEDRVGAILSSSPVSSYAFEAVSAPMPSVGGYRTRAPASSPQTGT